MPGRPGRVAVPRAVARRRIPPDRPLRRGAANRRDPHAAPIAALELERLPTLEPAARRRIADRRGARTARALRPLLQDASRRARERIAAIEHLALQAGELAQMDYDFLYDEARHLLAIGYNVSERRRDASYYDLLASEARLGSFVAIAQGQLPQESWFALGRLLTSAGGEPTLLSWSGSMFEYLMPLLVMPTYENTLLDQTYQAAVARQIDYGKQRGVPWGVSESGYNTVDVHLNYQYRAFGVPGLGLKRGLAEDLVIAPYASALALMVAPEAACLNLQRLAAAGFAGRFGFYEAIDYTPSRLPRGQASAVVRSFMAHHQGMSFLALAYLLLDRPMQRRFESAPLFQATALLLQERIPKTPAFYSHTTGEITDYPHHRRRSGGAGARVRPAPTPRYPQVQLLSNGRYHVMVTNAGGGYSRWKDLAVTRWREDTTCDPWGTFCYLRDVASGAFWSTAYQPTLQPPDTLRGDLLGGTRRVSPPRPRDRVLHRDRRLAGRRHRTAPGAPHQPLPDPPGHRGHQLRGGRARPARRGRAASGVQQPLRADRDPPPATGDPLHPPAALPRRALALDVSPDGGARGGLRRGVLRDGPDALHRARPHRRRAPGADARTRSLSGSAGSVLDPIVAIRYRITLDPDQSATIDLVSGIGDTREAALGLVEKYQDQRLADRVFDLAWTHSQVVLRQLNASAGRRATLRPPGQLDPLCQCRRCAPRRAFSARTGAGNPGCGATRCPAMCRSCCCRSATRRTSSWSANWCRPMPIGA